MPTRPETQPYAGPRLIRVLAGAVLLVGLGLAVGGTAFWLNGATHVDGRVTVPVDPAAPGEGLPPDAIRVPGFDLPPGSWVETGGDSLVLRAVLVLDRLGRTGPGSPFEVGVTFPLLPVLVAPVILALAEAFRRGAELADDVDGLV